MEQQAVLALHRPRPGRETRLRELVARHVPLLRRLGLLAESAAVLMRTAGGTQVEIFRWRSPEAARAAGAQPEVRQLWRDISEIADSPAIDASPEMPMEAPRLVPVTLEQRSSEPGLESRPKLGGLATVVGALSLVPLAGAPLALIAIVWGFLTRKRGANWLVWMGLGGLAISVAAVIVILAFRTYDLPFGPMKQMLARQELAAAVEAVEFHKVQTGHYPEALTDLRDSQPRDAMPFIFDPSRMSPFTSTPPGMFYYERIDADHYYLLGVGADDKPFTTDDIVPTIDIKPGSHVGLTIKH